MEPIVSRIDQLQLLSSQGDPDAQTELGVFYLERMICIEDYIALDLFKQAAAKGNKEAKFRLGMMFSNGRGTAPNKNTALYWYRQAASENHPDARFALEFRNSEMPSFYENMHILDLAETSLSKKELVSVVKGIKNTAIKALHLKGNKLNDSAVKVLCTYLKGSHVRTLDLWKNQISSKGLITLTDALKEMQIEILDLAVNEIDDEGVVYCAGKIADSSLHTLHLGDNKIGYAGSDALAQALPNTQLKVLDMGRNKLEGSGINSFLSRSDRLPLKILDLAENIKSLKKPLEMNFKGSPIEYLDLKLNGLEDDHIFEFAKTFPSSKVCALNLRDNNIGPKGVIRLTETMPPCMRLLNLRGNPIGDEGAMAVAEAIKKIPLETLNISGCGIGTKGFQAILNALPESQIHTLNLGGNRLGNAQLDFRFSKKLKNFDLAGNGLGHENGIKLGEAIKTSALEKCDLSGNKLENKALGSIFANLPTTMKVLNVSSNRINREDWEKSVKNLRCNLETLNLSCNPIGDNGLETLLDNVQESQIHTLDLSNCNITDTGAQSLLKSDMQIVGLKENSVSAALLQQLSQSAKTKKPRAIPLVKRDLSLVVDADYTFEDLEKDGITIMNGDHQFIDHFEIVEEIPYDRLLEVAKRRLRIKKHQKNLVIRIFFKSNDKKELKGFSDKLYKGLNFKTRNV